jgi:hypothetical protein
MSPPQVLEYRELATARQKDRLNGNGRSGDYGRQLVWMLLGSVRSAMIKRAK